MSYYGYNPPYLQPPTTRPEDSNNYPNNSDASRPTNAYSSSSYQPLSAYQSQHGRQQQQTHSRPISQATGSHSSRSYSGLDNSAGASRQTANSYKNRGYEKTGESSAAHQSLKTTYTSSHPDTTALGNLAYASSLGQHQQPLLSQIIDYNRAQGGTNYGSSDSYGNRQSSQGEPYSASFQTANARSAYQGRGIGMNEIGRRSPAQQQQTPSQSQQQHSQAFRRNQYAQSPRPASAQAIQRPSSTSSNWRKSNYNTSQSAGSTAHRPPIATPQAQHPAHAPTSSHWGGKTSNNQKRTSAQQNRHNYSGESPSSAFTATVNTNANRGTSQHPTPTDNQHPTTVDPNQVFNHYEYQRRQTEAEVARKAAEQAKGAVGAETSTSAQAVGQTSPSVPSDDVTQAAKAMLGASADVSGNTDSATKEQMELEMKQMIEKMRDYKAKDPTLFSQVWEQVKKGQPPQRASSQLAPESSTVSPMVINGKLVSPIQADLPAESDLPAASSFPKDFDRGRYPMQRRRRGNLSYTPSAQPSHHKKSPAALNAGYNRNTTANSRPTQSPYPDPTSQGMHKPLEQFKRTSASLANPPNQQPDSSKPPKASEAQKGEPPEGTTYWPEHKKWAIADAAQLALTSTSLNVGKMITSDEIHALLDRNPSYSQMCEYLENKSFVIERGHFARVLLAAVPDITSARPPNNIAKSQAPPPKPPQATTNPPTAPSVSLPRPSPYNSSNGNMTPQAPFPSSQERNLAAPAYYPVGSPFSKPEEKQDGNITVKDDPASAQAQSKQEKAKKRSFGDIVDLTTTSDDEGVVRRRPIPRVDRINAPDQKYSAQPHTSAFASAAFSGAQRPVLAPSLPGQPNVGHLKPPKSGREHLLYDMVVEPMNRRRDALRRSSYDSRTICRDILIASGRHPTMAPLNQHLDALREKFVSVENNADLSTFRWDLVDPGGHPPPKPIEHRVVQSPDHQDADKNYACTATTDTSTHHPPQIAVQIGRLSPGSGQPTSVAHPMNTKSKPLRKGRPPMYNSRVNGSPGSDGHPNSTPESRLSPALSTTGQARQEVTLMPTISSTPVSRPAAPNLMPTDSEASSAEASPNTPALVPGRRGRPPGAKNKQPRPDKGFSRKSRLSLESTPSPTTSSLPSHRNCEISTPMRPSGLRNVVTPTSGVAVVIPSRSPSIAETGSAKKARGMIKQGEPSGRHSSAPSYKIYKCRWGHCPAELHNLDTLRKHIRKQHRERLGDGPWPCKWADCSDDSHSGRERHVSDRGEATGSDERGGNGKRLTFEVDKAWDTHMEIKHLSEYVSELGDGPAAYRSETSDHLSGSYHRSADSLAQSSNKHSTDSLPLNPGPQVAKAYQEAHQNDTMAETLLATEEARGGIGIYKTRPGFVTDSKRGMFAKNGGFLDEEIKAIEGGDAGIGGPGSLNGG